MANRVLLVGANGYIGRNVLNYLNENSSFNLFGVDVDVLDFRDFSKVKEFVVDNNIETTIQLAAVPLVAKEYSRDLLVSNILIQTTLLRLRLEGHKVISFCSGSIFGRENWKLNMLESDALSSVPLDEQSLLKYHFELTRRSLKVPFFSIRLFGVYGGDESYLYKFVPNTIVKMLLDYPVRIAKNRVMSLLHIFDIAKVLREVLELDMCIQDDINISGPEILLSDLALQIKEYIGSKSPIIFDSRLERPYSGDMIRFRSYFPNFEFTQIGTGLEDSVAYWRDRLDTIDRIQLAQDDYYSKILSDRQGKIAN